MLYITSYAKRKQSHGIRTASEAEVIYPFGSEGHTSHVM